MFCPYFYLQCIVIKQTIIYTMLYYPMDHIDSIKQFTYTILKPYKLSELIGFVHIQICQYSMFYSNKMFWTRSQV